MHKLVEMTNLKEYFIGSHFTGLKNELSVNDLIIILF